MKDLIMIKRGIQLTDFTVAIPMFWVKSVEGFFSIIVALVVTDSIFHGVL
jgi:hypothetical protein